MIPKTVYGITREFTNPVDAERWVKNVMGKKYDGLKPVTVSATVETISVTDLAGLADRFIKGRK